MIEDFGYLGYPARRMPAQGGLTEAMQVIIRAAVEARDPAGYKIKADVRLLSDRQHFVGQISREEEGDARKGRDVAAAEPAGVAAADGRSSKRRKRQSRADDANVQPPEILLWKHRLFSLLDVMLGLLIEVGRPGEALKQLSLALQGLGELLPGDAAHVPVLLLALKAIFLASVGLFLG